METLPGEGNSEKQTSLAIGRNSNYSIVKMNREDRNINGVNETQAPSEAVTPSRVSGEQQPAPDRY